MSFVHLTILALYCLGTLAYMAFFISQRNGFYRAGYWLMAIGFAGHTALILYKVLDSGLAPAHNFHEKMSFAGWAVAGVFLVFNRRLNVKVLGIYAAPLAAMIMGVSYQTPNLVMQGKGVFSSFWTALHVMLIFLGDAAFALACGIGILYLIQERAIKLKRPGYFFKRLPSLEQLDSTAYSAVIAGFALVTTGLIIGFIYAKFLWGRFWSGDPKEIWSVVTWLLYAALIHERLSVGWRGRPAAIMAIIGFALVVFTFFGVNFLFGGYHVEFIVK